MALLLVFTAWKLSPKWVGHTRKCGILLGKKADFFQAQLYAQKIRRNNIAYLWGRD
jgi:hypothetical protein